jgi:hypothetical protein
VQFHQTPSCLRALESAAKRRPGTFRRTNTQVGLNRGMLKTPAWLRELQSAAERRQGTGTLRLPRMQLHMRIPYRGLTPATAGWAMPLLARDPARAALYEI